MSDSTSDSSSACARLRSPVFIYAAVNLLLKLVDLTLVVISTCAMITPLLSGNYDAFHYFLLAEGNQEIWPGPYPNNYSVDALPRLLSSVSVASVPQLNGSDMINRPQAATIDEVISAVQDAQLKIGVHIWSGIVLMKCTSFVFSWLLLFSTKNKSYNGCLAWFSYSVPIFIRYLLQLLLDMVLGDFFLRSLQSQIVQGLNNAFQLIGLIILGTHLYQLYKWGFVGSGKMRNTSLPFQTDNDVSIREIINERY